MLLDARHATPGLRLIINELPPTAESREKTYQLEASGFPINTKVLLWAKEFDHSIHQLGLVFQVDKSGTVIATNSRPTSRPRRLDEMTFGPGAYPRGALWEVALVSVDRKLQAFAKTIPYPIVAHDAHCTVSLELVSHRGEKFLASGKGFFPGEEVITELRYAGRTLEKRLRASVDGSLPTHVLLHAAVGSDREAHYSVRGHSCTALLDYNWGEAALVRR